ncbi:DUF5133 domain-containing protein [Streptomyces sp. NPDC002004]
MLLPDKKLVKHLLLRYRAWERLMLAEPCNPTRRRHFEDTAYTLCVLMGRRTALEAATAAEDFLRPPRCTLARLHADAPVSPNAAALRD